MKAKKYYTYYFVNGTVTAQVMSKDEIKDQEKTLGKFLRKV